MSEKLELQLHAALKGHAAGTRIKVPAVDGVPTERYWRRRLNDAMRDNCVSVVPAVKSEPTVTTKAKVRKNAKES